MRDVLEPRCVNLPLRLPRHAPVYSSPLSRCLRLAQGLQAAGFAEPVVDARLREMDFGRWEGRGWSEVPRDQIDAWRDDIVRYVPPGGESLASLAERGNAFVAALPLHLLHGSFRDRDNFLRTRQPGNGAQATQTHR